MSEDQVRTYPAGCFGGEARIKILSDPLFSWCSLLIFDEARVRRATNKTSRWGLQPAAKGRACCSCGRIDGRSH